MREESKFYNSLLGKITKFTEKTISEVRAKENQLSFYRNSKSETQSLAYSRENLIILDFLLRQKDEPQNATPGNSSRRHLRSIK